MRARNQALGNAPEEHVGVVETAAGWVPYDSGNPALQVSFSIPSAANLEGIVTPANVNPAWKGDNAAAKVRAHILNSCSRATF